MSAQTAPSPLPAGPVELARDALAALRSLTGRADATFAPQWAFEERTSVIADLDRVVELATLYRSRVVAAHKTDGRWARSGDRTFENHRARTGRIGIGAARAEAELGEGFAQIPQAVTAVQDARVGLAHAQVLTRARARASAAAREALDAGGAAELLALAENLDVATFTRRVDAWIAAHDATAAEQHFEAVRARRYLRLTDRDGGTALSGFVDPLVGACLRTCLEAVTPVPGTGDERTGEQRTADALALIAARILDAGTDKIGAQIRPHISLIVPADTWATTRRRTTGTTPHQDPGDPDPADPDRGTSGPRPGTTSRPPTNITDPSGAGRHAGVEPTGAEPLTLPELDDGTVIPISELERIACDCELTRIVLDADGIPLDVGQTERTYSKSLRRAVLVRDGHCRWPGCTMRASWCEVHHVTWYSNGGQTSAANALSLCAFHHHEVHRKHLRITPTPRGHTFTRPDGSLIGTTTRDTGILRMLTPRRDTDDRPDGALPRQEATPDRAGARASTGAGAPAGSSTAGAPAEGGGTGTRADPRGSAGAREERDTAARPGLGPGGEPPPTGELF